MIALILYTIFPLLCILAIPSSFTHRNGSFAERVVYGIALYEVAVLIIGLLLGMVNQLHAVNYLAVMAITSAILCIISWKNGIRIAIRPVSGYIKTRRGFVTLVLAALIAGIYAIELGIDAWYGTKHIDGLWYHIPRVIFWRQHGNFDAWLTPVWSQIGLPLGADVVLGQKILLGSGWLGTGYVSFVLTIGAVACVYIIASDFGFSRWNAALSALLFSSFPVVSLRIWSMNSDITAAFPVLASYVVLRRVRNPNIGMAVFIVLNGVALACKQTVIFQAALLAGVAFWQCRKKIVEVKTISLVIAACILSASIITFSFLPVYKAFGDLDGGEGGRGHKVTSLAEFNHSVAMSACHWVLEPLGYLTPVPQLEHRIKSISNSAYNSIGANFDRLPEMWKPWPAQDIGRSGLASILFLPVLLIGLHRKVRLASTLFFILGFIPLSGILHSSPYFARYTIILLAGFALIWGGTTYFQHGSKRWILIGITAVNILSLYGVVLMRFYIDTTVKSKPGGPYYYLSDDDRRAISTSINGRPLHVITSDSLDALIAGPDISYTLHYVVASDNGDWNRELMEAGNTSNWLAVVHNGKASIPVAENRLKPNMIFPREVAKKDLDIGLQNSGWQRFKENPLVDLWRKP